MVLARFVLLAAVLLAASSVSAAVTIDLGPSDWRRWGDGTSHHHTNGLNTKFGQTVRMPPLNSNLNVTRNPVIPYGSIANGLRQFVRVNPASVAASAAVTGLFLAVDWVFDQESGSWMKEGTVFENPIDNTGWYYGSEGGQIYPDPDSACNDWAISLGRQSGYTVGSVEWSGNRYHKLCRGVRSNGTWTVIGSVNSRGLTCPSGYQMDNQGRCSGEGVIDLDSSDWQELEGYLPSAPAGQVGQAAGDAMKRQGAPLNGYTDMQMEGPASTTGPETSTTTTTETGDSVVTTTSTTTNYQYGDTTITTTNTTVTNTYVNGNHTSTETTTETPGELPVTDPGTAPAGEWPGFCDWASVVCNFIDWFQEPFDAPEVEWPLIEDQDYEEEFDFTLAASCPEPYTIELALFPPVQFNWQPFCDLATFIRPLVLASAAIFAAFISLGIARARN